MKTADRLQEKTNLIDNEIDEKKNGIDGVQELYDEIESSDLDEAVKAMRLSNIDDVIKNIEMEICELEVARGNLVFSSEELAC